MYINDKAMQCNHGKKNHLAPTSSSPSSPSKASWFSLRASVLQITDILFENDKN
jgi:hypothetical protein